jgi:hypothetical protein
MHHRLHAEAKDVKVNETLETRRKHPARLGSRRRQLAGRQQPSCAALCPSRRADGGRGERAGHGGLGWAVRQGF